MQRYEFCRGAKCAKLTITVEGEPPLILISKSPSLILEQEGQSGGEEFTHDMQSPIEKEFDFSIYTVEFLEGFWYYNTGENLPKLNCPMPGTYPIVDTGLLKKSDGVTDLYWRENKLYCYFDGRVGINYVADYYKNNQGACSYRVVGQGEYKFSDQQGILYQKKLQKKLTYEIECDACCKDNEILCDSNHFPGYTCYPIPPVSTRLLTGINDIRRYWR